MMAGKLNLIQPFQRSGAHSFVSNVSCFERKSRDTNSPSIGVLKREPGQ